MKNPAVAFVTCKEIGGIVPDDQLVADELRGLGVDTVPVCWDDGALPSAVRAFIVRSPWNYHLMPDAFMQWIDSAAAIAPVFNDPLILHWNLHKGYLTELAAVGVAVTPTVICRRHERSDVRAIMDERGWHEVVVKPAISASSYMTGIVGATPHPALRTGDLESRFLTDGQAHLEAILETRDALIQPFMPEIFTRGERSLIYIDGAYSHCVQKDAFNTGPGSGATVEADANERNLAERALRFLSEPQLYARVDLLRDAGGLELLMELELLDPELYVRFDERAPRRFAEAIARRINVGFA